MKIIVRQSYDLRSIHNYSGICDFCGTPLEYPGTLVVIISRYDELDIQYPIDELECPECGKKIERFKIYKNLNVTDQFKKVKK